MNIKRHIQNLMFCFFYQSCNPVTTLSIILYVLLFLIEIGPVGLFITSSKNYMQLFSKCEFWSNC